MAVYAIGDVQGCYKSLLKLLDKINFDEKKDQLIFCGDLVNRGGYSLQVLRWVYEHKSVCKVVLGNHDLSLLAQYYIPSLRNRKNKELGEIFQAEDCDKLMNWLLNQKLLIHNKKYNKVVVHAGIYPKWSLETAKREAKRVEKKLRKHPRKVFKNMYGAKPHHWDKNLKGMDRTRFVINSFTRMRFLFKNSGLNFKAKGGIHTHKKLVPWFEYKHRKVKSPQIIFGHWSALGLKLTNEIICLDTGMVWGGKLTAVKFAKTFKKSRHIIQV